MQKIVLLTCPGPWNSNLWVSCNDSSLGSTYLWCKWRSTWYCSEARFKRSAVKWGFSILHGSRCFTWANSLTAAAKLEIKTASLFSVQHLVNAFEMYWRFLTHLWGSLALTMIWTHSLLLKALSIHDFCACKTTTTKKSPHQSCNGTVTKEPRQTDRSESRQ